MKITHLRYLCLFYDGLMILIAYGREMFMATTKEFIEYVCCQLMGVGDIRYRKMFGEYMVYVDDRPVAVVCDNVVYVKEVSEIDDLMKDASVGFPYKGAKEHYVLDIDNRKLSLEVISELRKVIPVPKKKN